jgi:hypothetical protein
LRLFDVKTRLSLSTLLLVLAGGVLLGPPARNVPRTLEELVSARRARLSLSLQRLAGENLFRGKPAGYWRQQALEGNLRFTGWGFLWVEEEGKGNLLNPSDELRREVTPVFVELLRDGDPGVREFAIFGLGGYGRGEEAITALLEALGDKDEDVRWRAAASLSHFDKELTREERHLVADELKRGEGKENISFGSSWMTDEEMVPMRRWTNLRGLSIEHTAVTDLGLSNLAGLRRLQILRIRGTRVTDAGLVHLKGITSLVEVDVRDTQVTDEGVRELKEALPGVEVIR